MSSSSSEAEGETEEEVPVEQAIQRAIDELLPTVDLATMGIKKFTKKLSKHLGFDLSERRSFVQEALTKAINEMEDDESESSEAEEEESEEESEEEEEDVPKKKKAKTGGYHKPQELSPKLAKFLNEKEMGRPQIVSKLWEYIKAHNLQNPDNKREILLDDKMKSVFGCDMFTMFTMNKYISSHCHPFPPLNLSSSASKKGSDNDKKRKAAPTAKRKAGPKDDSNKKPRKTGAQPPWRLSDDMAHVIGCETCPRPQVVSKLWEYIKANNLQNPNDKREILCDDNLRKLFNNHKKVNMFSMNKFISKHLIEKV